MLKTLRNIKSLTQPGKSGVGLGDDSKAGRDKSKLDKSKVDNNKFNSGEVGDNEVEKKVQKLFKSKNLFKPKKTIGLDFLTAGARLAFIKLR